MMPIQTTHRAQDHFQTCLSVDVLMTLQAPQSICGKVQDLSALILTLYYLCFSGDHESFVLAKKCCFNRSSATLDPQNIALQTAPSPSPHLAWTSLILSTDLQIPLQVQSNDAMHTFPACAFHSQSGE